ncbi:DUF2191 domain-containing protein [Modestobacter sp. I12A-02628]|uniref:type II toxin-antitoxin system VapB family antitoxin n=1 Tax=Goekera deserti TaxID=2497753 RepID=UPI00128C4B9B|nr:type II toxin-antitoxin system VapB family antitoxin [Goekera deserti]MPQ97344.1 DUF2191 domain-containing protein [Goekera deserti]NDI50143.1 type II toxin-antitoxin system VapB family antitoxin [Goekera deserti]
MKTTIDIADALFAEAKAEAERRGTSLRSLVEDGLRQLLDRRSQDEPFVLQDLSVGGRGIRAEYLAGGHDAFLDAAYGPGR